jgi:antitoxin (DNA-binding transcriptional repressor) of toxin-antitoxin stability system
MAIAHGHELRVDSRAHELRAHEPTGPIAAALADAEAGEISFLTRGGRPVAAVVSMGQLAEFQATQDSRDVAEAEAIRARPGPRIPHDVIEAMMDASDEVHDAMAAALDARSGEDLSPDSVRKLWETVRARRSP